MRKYLLIFFVLVLTACDGIPARKDPNPLHLPPAGFVADSKKGEALYTQNCLSCHGFKGQGSNLGPPLVHKTYNPQHHADLAFHLAVKSGVRAHHWRFGDMKPLPEVSPESVGHIVSYLRAEQRKVGIN